MFKVGDRVKITKDGASFSVHYAGTKGVIIALEGRYYVVQVDGCCMQLLGIGKKHLVRLKKRGRKCGAI